MPPGPVAFEVQVLDIRTRSAVWRTVATVRPSDAKAGQVYSTRAPELFAPHAYMGFLVLIAGMPPALAQSLPLPDLPKLAVNEKRHAGEGAQPPESADATEHCQGQGQEMPERSTTAHIDIVNVPSFRRLCWRVIKQGAIIKPFGG